jgi:putative N6-adenine-specific DNA methylase
MGKQIRKMIAKTMAGLEDILATELEEIGAAKVQKLNRAVSFEGDLAMMYKANYCCRTALSILVDKFSFKFNSQEDFYRNILNYNWDPLFEHDTTFSVDATISGDIFTNSHYTALLCKDAIVDYFRKKYNQRPTVDRFEPHLKVNVYVRNDECSILLDSSGESLFKRGYRVATGDAPIKEVLAAGIIMLSGWNGETNFYAPMCGSGTFAIEAAMIASKIPAGYYREQFGFMLWPDFDELLWKRIKDEADAEIVEMDCEILASDIDPKMVKFAYRNAQKAKLHKDITITESSFEDFDFPNEGGTIIFNPPYGERLELEDVEANYKKIGDTLKQKCANYEVWMIAGGVNVHKYVGLKPSKKLTLYNGAIECKMLKYDMYEGTRKNESIENED